MTALLEARGLACGYGKVVTIVPGLDLEVRPGEVVALLGANGAGKTTTILTLAGFLPALGGELRWNGEPTRAPLHWRARNGLALVTEERAVLMRMTVAENLRVSGCDRARALELFPELEPHLSRNVGLLSGGQQQMLALAWNLARPSTTVLLADELSLGLAPRIVERLLKAVRDAADGGIGVLLVEQHVHKAMKYADRAYVMQRGRIRFEGTVEELGGRFDEIQASYLSVPVDADAPALSLEGGVIDCPRSDVDLWADEVLDDPYPSFRELRRLGPVVGLDRYDLAALPRYEEVRAALTQWQQFSSASGVGADGDANGMMPPSIISSDPPAHDEFRRPLLAQMSARGLAAVADQVAGTAKVLIDEVVAKGSIDVVADLARPFSLRVVCDFVGIPSDDRTHLPALTDDAFNVFGPPNERLGRAPAALIGLMDHAARMAEPGRLCPAAGHLDPADVAEQLMAYTWPGIDTTVHGLSAACYLLARHPDEWQRLRADHSLVPSAFNEVLRLHAPVHYFTRLTTEPVDVAGAELPAGTRVLVMYGSANRDERHYPDPDRFDVARNPADQLAFGRGIHLCAGMNLAKLEAYSLLLALLERVEGFELEGEPVWLRNNTLHGLHRLPVRLIPTSTSSRRSST